MFWRKNAKNEIHSTEYENLNKRFIETLTTLQELKIKLEILQTNYDNLRGIINRKLRGIVKDDGTELSKDINTPVILPFNGVFK